MTAISFALSVFAALLFAVSASMQQSAARTTARAADPHQSRWRATIDLFSSLFRQPIWLAGLVINGIGFIAHATALRYGSVPVVQALLVLQLLFALPLAAVRRRLRPLRRDWLGTALIATGLVLLVIQNMPRGHVDRESLPHALLAVVGGVLLLGAVAMQLPRRLAQPRSALLGVAAGCCSCATAVLLVVATTELPRLGWAAFGVAVSAVISGFFAQAAFASGSLPTALTAMTVTDPVLSYVASVTLFVTPAHPAIAGLAAVAALIAIGVALLANSPTIHDELDLPAAVVGPDPHATFTP